MEQCLLGLLALLGLFCPFWRFPFYIPTLLPTIVLIVRTPTEGHSIQPLNLHIVADTPKGLHLDNRWSVSAANATTGCYSLSHIPPKGVIPDKSKECTANAPFHIKP